VKATCTYNELAGKDTHEYLHEEVLFWVDENQDFWNVVRIDGKSLEEVLQNAYIINIS
jgi:hypothetical protein